MEITGLGRLFRFLSQFCFQDCNSRCWACFELPFLSWLPKFICFVNFIKQNPNSMWHGVARRGSNRLGVARGVFLAVFRGGSKWLGVARSGSRWLGGLFGEWFGSCSKWLEVARGCWETCVPNNSSTQGHPSPKINLKLCFRFDLKKKLAFIRNH